MKGTVKLFKLLGIIAVLAVIWAFAGCASTDQQLLKKEGVPVDQRANLYLIKFAWRVEKIDGKKQGYFVSLYGGLGGWPGILESFPQLGKEVTLRTNSAKNYNQFPIQVSAGEHTLVISDEAIIGRKNYEGTFNFEAGKNYLIRLVTPTEYETMMKGATWEDLAANTANTLKEALAGNQIIVIAETKKKDPTWYDSSIPNNSWIKSIK